MMDQALKIHHPDIAREKNIRPGLCPASDAKELSSMSSLSRKEHRVMLHTAHLSKSMPKGPNNHNPSGILRHCRIAPRIQARDSRTVRSICRLHLSMGRAYDPDAHG